MTPRACVRCLRPALTSPASCLPKLPSASPPTSRLGQRRAAHSLPSLGSHNDDFLARGVDGLYSAEAVEQSWTKYMNMLLNRLNDICAGDKREHMSLKDILLDTARNPATANTFNYASMAHNNHFYWSTIAPAEVQMPQELEEAITRSFSSMHTFRSSFLATAASMFGPGYVWLVQQSNPPPDSPNVTPYRDAAMSLNLRILPTYLAGSPYPAAHARQQSRDLNTSNFDSLFPANSPGAIPPMLQSNSNQRYGGAAVVPLMCVSTWEHSYLLDWGSDGRRLFLQAWWDHIDWNKVWANATMALGGQRRRFV